MAGKYRTMHWEATMRRFTRGFVFFLFILSACSNDSVFEGVSENTGYDAKIEKAAMDLDSGNYDEVITDLSVIYNTMNPNPEVGRLLASAYMGKAWVDTTYFVENSPDMDMDIFDIMASVISSPEVILADTDDDQDMERYIDGIDMPDRLTSITKAKRALFVLDRAGLTTEDDIIQLGIASSVHFIMYVGNKTDNDKAPINTEAYMAGITVTASGFREKTDAGASPSYQEDLMNINDAVAAFSEAYPDSDAMRDSLDAFLHAALGETPGAIITDDLILNYTTLGIYEYVQDLAD
ncbi:MAG: hypothetical protein LLG43_08980 [Deltaproteobacteria bacterium]|nr:hypothetical protein [Deltaproteobacteria bacterium]